MNLTKEKMIELGFVCEREPDKMNDRDGLWYKDGITIHQEFWDQENFNYATRTRENGDFKGGYGIKTVERLCSLYEGITGNKLK